MKPLLISTIFACVLGMFQYGYSVTCMNQPRKYIETFIIYAVFEHYGLKLTHGDASNIFIAINALFNIMGMAGALNAGWMSTRYGRKVVLQISALSSLISSFAIGSCKEACSLELLVLGRALAGLSAGLNTVLVPLVLNEASARSSVGALSQLSTAAGIFAGLALGSTQLGDSEYWPVVVMLTGVPAAAQFILQIFNPESPTYLVVQCKDPEAGKAALRQLASMSEAEAEEATRRIQKDADSSSDGSTSVFMLLTSLSRARANILNLLMHFASQASGISAVYAYSTSFFMQAGLGTELSRHSSTLIGGCMFAVTALSVPLISRAGPRTLLLSGTFGMLCAAISVTAALNWPSGSDLVTGWVLVASTGIFCASFALGPGPVPWMATADIFNQCDKAAAMSTGIFVRWFGSLAIVVVFPQVQQSYKEFVFVPSIAVLGVLLAVTGVIFPSSCSGGRQASLQSEEETEKNSKDETNLTLHAQRSCYGVFCRHARKSVDFMQFKV